MLKSTSLLFAGILALAGLSLAQDKKDEHGHGAAVDITKIEPTPSPKGARVYIIGLKDGKTVPSKFTVRFGLKGMGIAPAGIVFPNTGHHHLLIDVADDAMPDLTKPLPMSDNIRHFGAGQTEVDLELPAGEHTLQLVLGDHLHIPHTPVVVSKKVKIIVDPDFKPAAK